MPPTLTPPSTVEAIAEAVSTPLCLLSRRAGHRIKCDTLEDLRKIVLVPTHGRPQPGKLPDTVYLLVEMLVGGVPVASPVDPLHVRAGVAKMIRPQLMMSDDFGVGDALPFCGCKQVLRLDERVAEEAIITDHFDKVVGQHGIALSSIIHHKSVIDLTFA